MKNFNLKDTEFKVVSELVKRKLGVEPSIMRLTINSDLVMNQLKNKTKLWYYSILTEDGIVKDIEELLEYDPGNIYIFKSLDKVFILYASQHKNGVNFLVKNIYKQIKKQTNGNN